MTHRATAVSYIPQHLGTGNSKKKEAMVEKWMQRKNFRQLCEELEEKKGEEWRISATEF